MFDRLRHLLRSKGNAENDAVDPNRQQIDRLVDPSLSDAVRPMPLKTGRNARLVHGTGRECTGLYRART